MPVIYRRDPLTRPERDDLLRACRDGLERSTILVLLSTGLRVAEFCRAAPDDLDYQAGSLRVHGKCGPFGTVRPVRFVPVVDREVFAVLEALLRVGSNRVTPRTVQRLVSRVASRARLTRKVSPHVLRHTFSVDAIRRGVSLAALQRALGHDHLSSTQVYLNLSAADAVDDFRRHP